MLQAEYRELAETYTDAVKAHFAERLLSICFFGSVARGEATPESDLDALVVAKGLPRDLGMRVRETNPLHEAIRKTEAYRVLRSKARSTLISDLYMTPEEIQSHPPILLDIVDHGIIIHDTNGFLAGVLEQIRDRLREFGGRKVRTKTGYYWILKPDAKPMEVVEI